MFPLVAPATRISGSAYSVAEMGIFLGANAVFVAVAVRRAIPLSRNPLRRSSEQRRAHAIRVMTDIPI